VAYYAGLEHVLPAIAWRVSSNPEAYAYLGESIRDWPAQAELARRITKAGWTGVAWRNLALGAVALHAPPAPRADSQRLPRVQIVATRAPRRLLEQQRADRADHAAMIGPSRTRSSLHNRVLPGSINPPMRPPS
jgi:hypothetical protein